MKIISENNLNQMLYVMKTILNIGLPKTIHSENKWHGWKSKL